MRKDPAPDRKSSKATNLDYDDFSGIIEMMADGEIA
jgi:hypothetical protein